MIENQQLDKKAETMLIYLLGNKEINATTMAQMFNDHYKQDINSAIRTLEYLRKAELIIFKTDIETISFLSLTHQGEVFFENASKRKKEKWKKLGSNIVLALINGLIALFVTILTSNIVINVRLS